MQKKVRVFSIIGLILIMMNSVMIPHVLAKPRQTYLTEFVLDTKIEGTGFSNSILSNTFSYEATDQALKILNHYDLYEIPGWFGAVEANVNISLFTSSLSNKINGVFGGAIVIYDLYYLLGALKMINYTFTTALKDRVKNYIDDTAQIGGGFAPTNTSTLPSLSSTYFVIQLYVLISQAVPNEATHESWVISCLNGDGGFGGNSSLTSTLTNTFYGVSVLGQLNALSLITDKTGIINYLNNNFLVSDVSNVNNHGGYLPDVNAKHALISSTYQCIKTISLLNSTKLPGESTISFILNSQNFQDGGFADNTDGIAQIYSSVSNTYYAFEILKLYQADLSLLTEDLWMIEFNSFILIIVLTIIGIIFALAVITWRKRRI